MFNYPSHLYSSSLFLYNNIQQNNALLDFRFRCNTTDLLLFSERLLIMDIRSVQNYLHFIMNMSSIAKMLTRWFHLCALLLWSQTARQPERVWFKYPCYNHFYNNTIDYGWNSILSHYLAWMYGTLLGKGSFSTIAKEKPVNCTSCPLKLPQCTDRNSISMKRWNTTAGLTRHY